MTSWLEFALQQAKDVSDASDPVETRTYLDTHGRIVKEVLGHRLRPTKDVPSHTSQGHTSQGRTCPLPPGQTRPSVARLGEPAQVGSGHKTSTDVTQQTMYPSGTTMSCVQNRQVPGLALVPYGTPMPIPPKRKDEKRVAHSSSSSSSCERSMVTHLNGRPARAWVLENNDLRRLILSCLTLAEAAICRNLNREWFVESSIVWRDLWLAWFLPIIAPFDLPLEEKKQAIHVAIADKQKALIRLEQKEALKEDDFVIQQGQLAASMQPLAFADFELESSRLREAPHNPNRWGNDMAKWFASHCGTCGEEMEAKKHGATFANNVFYGLSHICRDCIKKAKLLERVDEVSDAEDGAHVPLQVISQFQVFHSPDPDCENRDVMWLFTSDANLLRGRYREQAVKRTQREQALADRERKWLAAKEEAERKARYERKALDLKRKRDEEGEADDERRRKKRREQKEKQQALKQRVQEQQREIEQLRRQVAEGRGLSEDHPIELF